MSKAYRRPGTAIVVAAAILLCPGFVEDAFAFKIFGFTIFGEDEDDVEVIDPVRYDASFSADVIDPKLRESLENSSLLLQDVDRPVSGDLGIVVKAREDRDRLIANLYENARYGGVVKITIAGTDIDSLPPVPVFNHSSPVPVKISVETGPVFHLGKIRLEGDAAGRDPQTLGLETGATAGSLTILKAGEKLADDLRQEGRPLARVTRREVVANHATQTVDVTLAAISGPVAPVGMVGIKGQRSVDPEFIRRYSRLNEGRPYSPEDIRKASERLRQLGVFSSVTIKPAETLAANGSIPMTIEVSEGKHRYFGFGVQATSTDGAGVQGYWGHRNLFGEAESLRIEAALSRIGESTDYQKMDYSAGILFTKPGAFFPAATFKASLTAKTEHPDSYEASTITGMAGLSYELTDVDTVSAGGEVSYSDVDDAFGNNKYLTLAVPLEYVRDTRDNKLDPTAGYRGTVSTKPSYEVLEGTFFSSFEGSISGYQSFLDDNRIVMAGKISAGTLIGGSELDKIPATRRFYAGGGGSVRGYSYQEISPYDANGEATGGVSYVTGSVEARVKVTETIGIVPFLDVGSVSSEIAPDFSDIRAGAGLGLRYATPFGPLRLDVAVPLKRYDGGSQYGIYAGIGQTF